MNIVSTLIEAHIVRVVESELEFLLLKRAANELYPNIWQMVTGSIDKNEKAYQTALREIKEETGLFPKQFWIVPNVNSFYSSTKDEICMLPVFAALVNENCKVQISDEHSDFKWLNKEEAKKLLAWPGQRNSVDIIYEYFTNKQGNLKFVEISLQ